MYAILLTPLLSPKLSFNSSHCFPFIATLLHILYVPLLSWYSAMLWVLRLSRSSALAGTRYAAALRSAASVDHITAFSIYHVLAVYIIAPVV